MTTVLSVRNTKNFVVLVPDLHVTQEIINDFSEIGIKKSNIRVVGEKRDIIQKIQINEAKFLKTPTVYPTLKRGAIIGAASAVVLCGIYTSFIITNRFLINPFIILCILILGTIIGVSISTLIGFKKNDPRISLFQAYLNRGHYILMVNAATDNEIALAKSVLEHHPSARVVK